MPTAARLVAAMALAGVGYLASLAYVPYLPEDMPTFWLGPINAGIGVIMGWRFLGRRVQGGAIAAAQTGILSAALGLFWSGAFFAIKEMLTRSMNLRYKGMEDALMGVGDLWLHYVGLAMNLPVVGVLAVGGAAAGVLAQIARRMWR